MVEAIMAVLQAFLNFMGIMANPQASKKVEDVLPEKSASEQALEQLQGKTDDVAGDVAGAATYRKP